jgi:hypothetical protein
MVVRKWAGADAERSAKRLVPSGVARPEITDGSLF